MGPSSVPPPPLHEDHDNMPSETDPLLQAGLQRGKTGRPGDLIAAVITIISVVALAAFTWTLVFTHNPKGLGWFAFHPPLQTLSIVCFVVGILSLQTTSLDNPDGKRKGLVQHQVWNGLLAYNLIAAGGIFMIYNKYAHGAPHLTSWHGRFGLLTLILITTQALIGGGSVWFGGKAFGGGDKAKAIYKYHRMSGYAIVVLLLLTVHLAGGWSDWVVNNTSSVQRVVVYTVLPILVLVGLAWRVRPGKMKFW